MEIVHKSELHWLLIRMAMPLLQEGYQRLGKTTDFFNGVPVLAAEHHLLSVLGIHTDYWTLRRTFKKEQGTLMQGALCSVWLPGPDSNQRQGG